ncbi:NAD(P)/FAD-dependent oxidoreductase [bacterium]|nr:NAD(P)/FAD-dependent oxidoreductase [bacterium]
MSKTRVSEHHDLIVVGAGPAGSACAEKAAKCGLNVRVFERARFPRPKPCAAGLSSIALGLLGDSVIDIIHCRMSTVEVHVTPRVTVTWHGDHTVTATTTRRELDARLVELAVDAGAEVVFGTAVSGIRIKRGAVEVDAGDRRATAAWVVLADGANGRLGRKLGLP